MTGSFIFDNLKEKDRKLMEKLNGFLLDNTKQVGPVCTFLANKIGDKELVEDFKNLSDDIKVQACIEYLAIGLASGQVQTKDIEDLLIK